MTTETRFTPSDYGHEFLVALQAVESALRADESLAATARGDLQYVVNAILDDATEELRKDVCVYLSCTARYGGDNVDPGPLARKLRGRRKRSSMS